MVLKQPLTNPGDSPPSPGGTWMTYFFGDSPAPDDSGKDLRRVVGVIFLGLSCGIAAVFWHEGRSAGTSLLWALASLVTGGLVGFLFGIPRVEQALAPVAANPALPEQNRANAAAEDDYRQRVNTNLEQISDWLTKIIVGIGLVELKNIPRHLESVAAYQAACTSSETCPAYAGALIVYFSVLGFFSGYLLTRLFLSPAFAVADRLSRLQRRVQAVQDFAETTRKAVTEGVGKQVVRTAATTPPSVPPEEDDDDIQKGKWGGRSEANGRLLRAMVTPTKDDEDWFKIMLEVVSTDMDRPLTGYVTFHLHQTFHDPERVAQVKRGVARITVLAVGAFTVGAEADDGETKLELDLASLEDAPAEFRER